MHRAPFLTLLALILLVAPAGRPAAAQAEPAPEAAPAQSEPAPEAAPALEEIPPRPALPTAPPVITSVDIVGHRHIPADLIRTAISSEPGAPYSEDRVTRDRQAVVDLGWFETVAVERESVDGGVRLLFRVAENPVVNDIQFEGNRALTREQLLAAMDTRPRLGAEVVAPDMVFSRARLLRDVQAIEDRYRRDGYILAMVADRAMTNDGVLILTIAEGIIEDIRIEGNTHTKTHVIRRYLRTQVGDTYNDRQVARDIARLVGLDYFETVRRDAEMGTDYGQVILVITVVEKRRTGLASVGGGYSSVQGLVGFVDLVKTNLGGTGQMVSFRAEFGGRDSYEVGYRHPWVMTPETRLSLGLYNRFILREAFVRTLEDERRSILYDERRSGGNLTLGRPLSDFTSGFVSLRADEVSISGLTAEEEPYLGGAAFLPRRVRSITLAGISDTRLRDETDDRFNPHRGAFHQLSLEFAGMFGGAEFNKYTLDNRRYFRVGERSVLALRLLCGVTTGDPPYLEQFLIGGTESLRGFRSDRFAGARMVLLNTEYRMRITDTITGVAFFDAGDAWGGSIAADPFFRGDPSFTPHFGYGAGVRIRTPIGPLRLDLGFSSEGTETHFGVAHMF